jgi:hypothetical protein
MSVLQPASVAAIAAAAPAQPPPTMTTSAALSQLVASIPALGIGRLL